MGHPTMTRTPRDWRQGALSQTTEDLAAIHGSLADHHSAINVATVGFAEAARKEEPDRETLHTRTEALRDALRRLADDAFDHALTVHRWQSGSALRRLRGEEPLNYSTPDGGAKHDAYYGAQAQQANFARRITWPLDLGDWSHEKGERTRDGIEPVTASGTEKYTTTVGGAKVALVVDDRGRSPL